MPDNQERTSSVVAPKDVLPMRWSDIRKFIDAHSLFHPWIVLNDQEFFVLANKNKVERGARIIEREQFLDFLAYMYLRKSLIDEEVALPVDAMNRFVFPSDEDIVEFTYAMDFAARQSQIDGREEIADQVRRKFLHTNELFSFALPRQDSVEVSGFLLQEFFETLENPQLQSSDRALLIQTFRDQLLRSCYNAKEKRYFGLRFEVHKNFTQEELTKFFESILEHPFEMTFFWNSGQESGYCITRIVFVTEGQKAEEPEVTAG